MLQCYSVRVPQTSNTSIEYSYWLDRCWRIERHLFDYYFVLNRVFGFEYCDVPGDVSAVLNERLYVEATIPILLKTQLTRL